MDSAADMHARHAKGLAELAELGLMVARDLQAKIAGAEGEDAAKLATAFHHVSRTVRQTYALEARLHRDADRDTREESERIERAETRAHEDRLNKHRDRVSAQVDRLIWTEHEADEELEDRLYDLLCEARAEDDFLDTPVDTLVERIRKDLGLSPPVPPPQGEGDREAVEGVEAHSQLNKPPSSDAAPFNPLSRFATAPPEGEQLEPAAAPPPDPPSPIDRWRAMHPSGPDLRPPLPGELGPNGETGDHCMPDQWMI